MNATAVAWATVTAVTVAFVTVARTAFSAARCPNCRTLVMAIPGPHKHLTVKAVSQDQDWGECQGRVIRCPGRKGVRGSGRCETMLEVIEHG